MSAEADAFRIAVQAQESAKQAHYRLDRMNGSIDRLTSEIKKSNDMNVEILQKLAGDDGEARGAANIEKGFLDERRHVWATISVLMGALITAVATLATVLIK